MSVRACICMRLTSGWWLLILLPGLPLSGSGKSYVTASRVVGLVKRGALLCVDEAVIDDDAGMWFATHYRIV